MMNSILNTSSQHPHHHQDGETSHLDNHVDNYVIEELNANSLSFPISCPSTKVYTSRKARVLQKLSAIRNAGIHKLKIVSDFDYTMTKFWIDGSKKGSSCHKIIEDCGFLTHEYHEQAEVLEKKYYPLENDPSISIAEKAKHMEDWAHGSRRLLIKSGLTNHVITRAVDKALSEKAAELRERVDRFISTVEQYRVPTLIFSAGVADILEEVLKHTIQFDKSSSSSVFVVSNRCIFEDKSHPNEEVGLKGFSQPVIHVFNKKSSSFLDSPFFKDTDEALRDNVILIGDSIGDLLMVEGMTHTPANLLRIGFLNSNVEARLKQYTDMYDIVITGNFSTFEVPMSIIESVIESTPLRSHSHAAVAASSQALSVSC